jgi:hypothetical protein
MTRIHCVHFTKKKLAEIPEAERSLLLLLGHASNEINVFSKLILMARKDDPGIKLIDHVETGQVFILMRVLIGKLHEAWLLFNRRFQANRPLAEKYEPKLPPTATDALKALNKHFGAGSRLTAIRSGVSFHYADNDNLAEATFQRLSGTEPWDFYLARTVGNTFYYASELVIQGSVISLAMGKPKGGAAMTDLILDTHAFVELCDNVIVVSGHITELFGEVISLIVANSIGGDVEMTTVEIPDGPKMSTFCLPYFFDENDSFPRPAAEPQ